DDLGLAGFCGAIGLLTSAAGNFGVAHGNSRTIHAQAHGGSHVACWFHAVVFFSGDLGTQRFGCPFHLTGAYLYPCQFAQQTAALDKTHQRCRAAGHAQYSRREREHLQPQMTVARTEPALALGAVIIYGPAPGAEAPARSQTSSRGGHDTGLVLRRRRAVLGRRNRRYRHSAVVPALVLPDTIPGAAQAKTAPASNQPVNRRAPHAPPARYKRLPPPPSSILVMELQRNQRSPPH